MSQEPQIALSSEHSNSASGSLEPKVKLAFGLSVTSGGLAAIVVFGASTVHVWISGDASARPVTVCTARTMRVCSPSSRLESRYGGSQEPHESGSIAGVSGATCAHSNSGSRKSGAWFRPGSLEVKLNVASPLPLGFDGACVRVVSATSASVAVTIPNGDRLSTISVQITRVPVSFEEVTSTQVVPLWWSRRAGSATSAG